MRHRKVLHPLDPTHHSAHTDTYRHIYCTTNHVESLIEVTYCKRPKSFFYRFIYSNSSCGWNSWQFYWNFYIFPCNCSTIFKASSLALISLACPTPSPDTSLSYLVWVPTFPTCSSLAVLSPNLSTFLGPQASILPNRFPVRNQFRPGIDSWGPEMEFLNNLWGLGTE